MKLQGIDHVALSVADVERSTNWYMDVLGFQRRFEGMWDGVPVFIGLGDTALALFPTRSGKASAGAAGNPRILHLAFRADQESFGAAQRELTKRGIVFEFQDHEISHSIYFRDPDGHGLEITTYEIVKG
jgi:catechol 2,3-dioxygenase-like lactoylglutathione lyase family enzyme